MKKILSVMLITLMTLGLTACAEASQNKTVDESSTIEATGSTESVVAVNSEEIVSGEQDTVLIESEKHILVAYFSVTGNTKTVAEKIASVAVADLYEIRPAIEYTNADINYSDSGSRTSKEQNDPFVRPEIQSETISLAGYDTIYVGYPIWWGEEPRIMDTFVESYDFADITMIPFCTSGSSGIGNSGKNLAENAGSGNWLAGKRFKNDVTESDIQEWISELQ